MSARISSTSPLRINVVAAASCSAGARLLDGMASAELRHLALNLQARRGPRLPPSSAPWPVMTRRARDLQPVPTIQNCAAIG